MTNSNCQKKQRWQLLRLHLFCYINGSKKNFSYYLHMGNGNNFASHTDVVVIVLYVLYMCMHW